MTETALLLLTLLGAWMMACSAVAVGVYLGLAALHRQALRQESGAPKQAVREAANEGVG